MSIEQRQNSKAPQREDRPSLELSQFSGEQYSNLQGTCFSGLFDDPIAMAIVSHSSRAHVFSCSPAPAAHQAGGTIRRYQRRSYNRDRIIRKLGPPFEKLKGGYNWGPGWIRIAVVRPSGRKAGNVDVYYYSPTNGHMIRSMKKAEKFIKALHENGGNESMAFDTIGRRG
jgi:hypothetical protein